MLATEAYIKNGISFDSTGYVSISGQLRPRLFSKTCAPRGLLNLEPYEREVRHWLLIPSSPCFAGVALTFSDYGS